MAQSQIIENYEDEAVILPELSVVGWNDIPATVPRLRPHRHRWLYELCVISKGEVIWWAGDEIYHVGKGDVYITRPNEAHGGVDSMLHACELYYLQIALPIRRTLPGMSSSQSRLLTRGYQALRHRHFAGSTTVVDCFKQLIETHRERGRFAELRARAALHELLVTILDDHDRAVNHRFGRDGDKSEAILRAMRWIDQHIEEDHYVEHIAHAAGLSVSRFHERFVDEVGLSPADYRMRRRVELAKSKLHDSDRSITDIAMGLGFSTSQYFATVFRKYTGMSPRTYRQTICSA